MSVFIASVIILALIIYAIKDLLSDRDFTSWINMALTTLILFTVILSIFMVLHKKNEEKSENDLQKIEKPAVEATQKPVEEMSDSDIMLAIAEEYIRVEDDYKTKNPDSSDSAKAAADFIINKYSFTPEEWNSFLEDAAKNDLFSKARARMDAQGINYLIAE